jgi:hypothetical protein
LILLSKVATVEKAQHEPQFLWFLMAVQPFSLHQLKELGIASRSLLALVGTSSLGGPAGAVGIINVSLKVACVLKLKRRESAISE